jgi:hypothetical protein
VKVFLVLVSEFLDEFLGMKHLEDLLNVFVFLIGSKTFSVTYKGCVVATEPLVGGRRERMAVVAPQQQTREKILRSAVLCVRRSAMGTTITTTKRKSNDSN